MITYPVDAENDLFTFRLEGKEERHRKWPRPDGQPLMLAEPGLVIMREVVAPDPVHDPSTHRLDDGAWTDDEANQVTTFARGVVELSAEELADKAAEETRRAKRQDVASAIATARQWATEAKAASVTTGSNNATTEVIAHRFGAFLDWFADFLEGHEFDQV